MKTNYKLLKENIKVLLILPDIMKDLPTIIDIFKIFLGFKG